MGAHRRGGLTMGERWMGDQRTGDQNGVGPKRLDKAGGDLNRHLKKAGPFAAGTGPDGFGLHDQRLVCQNLHLETADG